MKSSKWSSMLKAALVLVSLTLFAACATTPTDSDSSTPEGTARTPQSIQHRL